MKSLQFLIWEKQKFYFRICIVNTYVYVLHFSLYDITINK